uniref:Uncharacterized protein n=1 Tax=Schistocephalus solidus TaxID=70667 RepID=A0A0X3NGK1_SCHSO
MGTPCRLLLAENRLSIHSCNLYRFIEVSLESAVHQNGSLLREICAFHVTSQLPCQAQKDIVEQGHEINNRYILQKNTSRCTIHRRFDQRESAKAALGTKCLRLGRMCSQRPLGQPISGTRKCSNHPINSPS